MFEFGNALEGDPRFKYWLKKEFIERSQYEKYHKVKSGDIVVDIGASIGPFLYSIKDRNPSRVIAVEPLKAYQETLLKNSREIADVADYIYLAIGEKNKEKIDLEWSCHKEQVYTTTFKSLLSYSNIKHIDFLKVDCEGGEYYIFNEENIDWIKENVKYIAGEFHLNTPQMKESFKKVYNLLKEKNFDFKIESVDGIGINTQADNDLESFVNHYEQVILYIDNLNMKKLLFITPHLSTGGLPQYLYTKIKELKDDYEIHLVEWADITGGKLVVQRNKILEILDTPYFHTLGEHKTHLLGLLSLIQPDIVHLEEIPEMFMYENIADVLYSKDRKYFIVETSHDSSFDILNKKYFPDKFMLVSQYQINKFSELGIPCELVEYPIEYVERPDREEALKELGLDPNKKHILNIGLFTPRKNQAEFFEYARSLPQYEFHCVGNQADNFKDYWEPLMENKPDNLTWWGERSDVEKFYQAMDLFLFTSRGTEKDKETMPLVLREAISYQIPTLLFKLPVYLDYFDKFEGVTYLTFDHFEGNCNLIDETLSEDIGESQPKNVFIVSCYPSHDSAKKTITNCLKAIKDAGYDIILTSHLPIPLELQIYANYCVYDKKNILTHHNFYNKFWAENSEYKLEINLKEYDNNIYHGPAVYTNYYNGASLAHSLGYDNAIFLNYDYILKDTPFIEWVITQLNSSSDFYFGTHYPQEGPSFYTFFFGADLREYLNTFPRIKDEKDYNGIVKRYNSPSNGLENLYYNILKINNFKNVWLDDSEPFNSDIKDTFEHEEHSQVEYCTIVDTNVKDTFAVIIKTTNVIDSREITYIVYEDNEEIKKETINITSPTLYYSLINYDPNKEYQFWCFKSKNKTGIFNVDLKNLSRAGKLEFKNENLSS